MPSVFAPPETVSAADRACRESGIAFLAIAAFTLVAALVRRDWLSIVDPVLLVPLGVLVWRKRSRIGATLGCVLALAIFAQTMMNVHVPLRASGGSNVPLALILAVAAVRGLMGTWAWRRLTLEPSAK